MLVDVIFKGILSELDFSFLRELLETARESYFNSPEGAPTITFDEIIKTINSNTYVDLVVNTDCLRIEKKQVPKVFVNLGRDSEDIEVLFYFDSNDLNKATPKMNLNSLDKWALEFQNKYGFRYFICQDDNAGKNEYYFDSNGTGMLYDEIN